MGACPGSWLDPPTSQPLDPCLVAADSKTLARGRRYFKEGHVVFVEDALCEDCDGLVIEALSRTRATTHWRAPAATGGATPVTAAR